MNLFLDTSTTSNYSDDIYNDTITTSEAYTKRFESFDEYESITIQYKNSLKNQISQALLLKFELSNEQLESLLSFLYAIIEIEQTCECEIKGIQVTSSIENEIVFYRKSLLGVSLLSIDSDGDLLFNFTGFKTGFTTESYNYGEVADFEKLIYNFLSR